MTTLFDKCRSTKPAARWALIIVAIAAIALIAPYMYTRYMKSRHYKYPPSWADIQAVVNAHTQWETYQEGGNYLQGIQSTKAERSNPGKADSFSVEENRKATAVAVRVTVDFLRSLTPEQVSMLGDKLPFSRLTQAQKKLLCSEPGYRPKSGIKLEDTYIRMQIVQMGTGDPYADFLWCRKRPDGREAVIDFGAINYYLKNVAKNQQPWN